MGADGVLVRGLIAMNEAALTGEPAAVQKFAVSPATLDDVDEFLSVKKAGKRHFVFSGTTCVAGRSFTCCSTTPFAASNIAGSSHSGFSPRWSGALGAMVVIFGCLGFLWSARDTTIGSDSRAGL
jgi:magnesium-transporting ATPase (P-type)